MKNQQENHESPKARNKPKEWFIVPWRKRWAEGLRVFWIAFAIVTLVISFCGCDPFNDFIACCWATLPPVYFFIEYHVLFDNKDDPVAVSEFRTSQDLAAKIWAGIAGILAVIYFKG